MKDRPSTLSSADRTQLVDDRRAARRRALGAVDRILDSVSDPTVRDHLATVAFTGTAPAGKRGRRPNVDPIVLLDSVPASDVIDERESVTDIAVATVEYYDLLDDLLDDDVQQTDRAAVLVASQCLVPVLVDRLRNLPAAADHWGQRVSRLVEAPFVESLAEPSADAYRDVLERQANLYGAVTALPSVLAGRDETAIDRAERVGRHYFVFDQLLLDGEQVGPDDRWNAWQFEDSETVLETVRHHREALLDAITHWPDPRSERLRRLVAIDLRAWVDRTDLP